MGHFKFKFSPVLFLKKIKEKEVLKELKTLKEYLEKEFFNKEEIFKKIKSLDKNSFIENKIEEINLENLKLKKNYYDFLMSKVVESKEAVTKIEELLKITIDKYLLIRKEISLLENFKEKDYLNFLKEENKKENKKSEDIVAMRNKIKRNSL